ncbi:hypothetical protein, conserved [Plasmodium gonderi]|uniref:Leucine-rich repeat-containing protein 51 n=1 Tax=Plasmodium gonderi TaxID=77519 RepID=A0A1Y1JNK2_PLAGO|nr:hypothetical protein, conserved [Plasmodium gonderi]GAW82402.1 hypothetical protein, conserved [Plasmodium gonderi]
MDSLNSVESIYRDYGSAPRYYEANDSLSAESNEESDSSEKRKKSLDENINNEENHRVEKYIKLESTIKIWAGTNEMIHYKQKDAHELNKIIYKHNNKDINLSTNLKVLNISGNNLENLDFLNDLINYIYQKTRIQTPINYSNIISLDISFNNLVQIHDNLLTLNKLKILYLHSNKIENISEIHKLISLPKLKKLTLGNNPIMNLYGKFYRPFVIHYLPQIKSLDFHDITKIEKNKSEIAFNTHKYKFNLV